MLIELFNKRFFVTQLSLIALAFIAVNNEARAQSDKAKYRKLAPGVLTKIKPSIDIKETFSGPRELTEITKGHPELNWQPKQSPKSNTLMAKAKSLVLQKPVWGLEISIKPIRIIEVNGKKVWYMVYQVSNNGYHKNPEAVTDDRGHVVYKPKDVNHTIRFFPSFVLESHEVGRAYVDDLNLPAFKAIAKREDKNRKFYNSVNISTVPIKVSTPEEDNSVWGIAMWNDVDPRTDFFSVYVRGLTNAYEYEDPAGAFKPGDPPATGRRYRFKTLQLNFWRPGDAFDLNDKEFRYGLPTSAQLPPNKSEDELLKIFRLQERVDHLWIYR